MTLDDFLPFMLVDLPGCPDPTVKQALLLSANEFCRESHCWDEVQDPLTLTANVRDYDLEGPPDGRCLLVRDVWMGARALRPTTMQELQLVIPKWRETFTNDPTYYNAAIDRQQISFYPTPDGTSTNQVVIRAVYVPTLSATSLPDFLGDRYLEYVVAGAKARLMATPGQTYSKPDAVAFHRERFDNGIALAKAEMMHDRVQGLVTVRPRQFI